MERSEALLRLTGSRVARLATLKSDLQPHIVPIVFVVADDLVLTMVDHKPKTTTELQRLRNIDVNPRVTVLADEYTEDWQRLWWVRVDGTAEVVAEGPTHSKAASALVAKYEQYREQPPTGPAIVISMDRVSWWASSV